MNNRRLANGFLFLMLTFSFIYSNTLWTTPISPSSAKLKPLQYNQQELIKQAAIGVIAHSRSYVAGHGPGVTTLFTSARGKIEPVIDE
ncbi:DUF4438 domain-containing protein [Candidatus Aminicenantes bacterium AC-334-K16]|jgi:hypothetical protein|nr:DUF4438 domain-containing protein [Candidatus Aminicenantes bacterium AC-334-K16]